MSTINKKSERKNIRFPHDVVKSVNKNTDNFSKFVIDAVIEKLKKEA